MRQVLLKARGKPVFHKPELYGILGVAAHGEHHNLDEALIKIAGSNRKDVNFFTVTSLS